MKVFLKKIKKYLANNRRALLLFFVLFNIFFFGGSFLQANAAIPTTTPLENLQGFTAADVGGWDPSAIPGTDNPVTNNNSISWMQRLAEFILNSVLGVIYVILWVVYSIAYGITLLSEKLLETMLDPIFVSKGGYLGGFTVKEFVVKAAQLLANLCNMLYLFVLIYIAIKTMFGSTNTRSLLVKLVIAALLTNFGLVLAGVVIDLSQVIMYSVWDGIKGAGSSFAPGTKILNNLQDSFQVGQSMSKRSIMFEVYKFITLGVGEAITELVKIAGLLFTSLALIVTLISITVILMVRIVMLWVLLILTPVAFLFSILPQTEKYWNEWLESLTKYAFTGPILIFFLWLGIKLSATVTSSDKLKQIGNNIPNGDDMKYIFFDLIAKSMNIMFEMGTIIITIWAGIIIANKFGIKGAKSIDGLIGSTGNLGRLAFKSLLVPGEALSKTLRGGTWLGYRISNWRRDKKLERLSGESGDLKAELDRSEKFGVAAPGVREKYESKQAEIKKLEEKKAKSLKSREKRMKRMAYTSPFFMKKGLSEYVNKLKGEYFSDMDNALKGFSNYMLNRGHVQSIAASGSREALFDYQTKINELTADWRKKESEMRQAKSPEEKEKLAGEKSLIEEKIKFMAEGIGKKTTEDKDKQKLINEAIRNKIFDRDGKVRQENEIPKDLITETGRYIAVDIFEEAANYAKKGALDFLRDTKIREEEAAKLKEALEEIKKEGDKFNADLAIRQVLRNSVPKVKQKAIMEHLATSSRNFGKLVSEINKFQGNKKENDVESAMKYVGDKFTEHDAVNILRIAEKDADKTNNLTQVGWMNFDPALGKARMTSLPEREEIIKKWIAGWSTHKKIAKTHSQVFDTYDDGGFKDESAVKILMRSVDWNYANEQEKLIKDIIEDISDKNRELLEKGENNLVRLVGDQYKDSLHLVVGKLRSQQRQTGRF